MRNFLPYNKEVLFSVIDRISITKEDQVVTKYGNRVIKVANVSNRYEIFDIAKYLKSKIDLIEKKL
jgi:ArsR family metal-binding transcriptional regulator